MVPPVGLSAKLKRPYFEIPFAIRVKNMCNVFRLVDLFKIIITMSCVWFPFKTIDPFSIPAWSCTQGFAGGLLEPIPAVVGRRQRRHPGRVPNLTTRKVYFSRYIHKFTAGFQEGRIKTLATGTSCACTSKPESANRVGSKDSGGLRLDGNSLSRPQTRSQRFLQNVSHRFGWIDPNSVEKGTHPD